MVDPMNNISQMGLKPTDHVADFGAGSGAYTIPMARIVNGGKVYAIEVLKDLLIRIENDAKKMNLTNIEYIWGDIESPGGTKLADRAIDYVVIANVLFQDSDKAGLGREAKRILKPGGKVMLIDWKDSFGGLGPQSTSIVSEESAKSIFASAGFVFEKNISAGEHHYGMIV